MIFGGPGAPLDECHSLPAGQRDLDAVILARYYKNGHLPTHSRRRALLSDRILLHDRGTGAADGGNANGGASPASKWRRPAGRL